MQHDFFKLMSQTKPADKAGINFYKENDLIRLADEVPARFIFKNS